MPIATALKVEAGIALIPAEAMPMPPVGVVARQQIDWSRRHRHMRVHTALHLLSVVIPLPVTGGQIATEKGRLDFDMPDPPGDVAALEEALNTLIDRNLSVEDQWISDEELLANPGLVKTMSVRPPIGHGRVRLVRICDGAVQVDLQPCGGTHVRHTGEIGHIEIGKIEKKGRQNRRVSISLT
jgi:misacylated tRNA(Ala) deacylase